MRPKHRQPCGDDIERKPCDVGYCELDGDVHCSKCMKSYDWDELEDDDDDSDSLV
jgi:hypothetical protein